MGPVALAKGLLGVLRTPHDSKQVLF